MIHIHQPTRKGAMTQRISDEILASLIARHRPERRQVTDLVELDLRDSRAALVEKDEEIKRLKQLTESGGK